MRSKWIGLTKLYNGFHSPDERDERMIELRELHCQMDEAVVAAYGWDDLELEHDFHEVGCFPTNDRIRFTISEKARIEVLRRLALLNRERYFEENSTGQSTKKGKTAKRKKSSLPMAEE
jgi:putative ubiquitin-RnfH superfamily antitoxin RatB of RatAB toxin-antitoxin module